MMDDRLPEAGERSTRQEAVRAGRASFQKKGDWLRWMSRWGNAACIEMEGEQAGWSLEAGVADHGTGRQIGR